MIMNYVLKWEQDPHIPVTLSCGVAMIIGKVCGYQYKTMLAAGLESVNQSLEAIIIILLVGCLIGSFTACGTIPAVVYYGLKLLTPLYFFLCNNSLCGRRNCTGIRMDCNGNSRNCFYGDRNHYGLESGTHCRGYSFRCLLRR